MQNFKASAACRAYLKDVETGATPKGKLLPRGMPALKAYKCPGGKWTCGWGISGAGITEKTEWTMEQCEQAFEDKISSFEHDVNLLIGGSPTTQGQFDAMLSFAWNYGSDIDADDKPEGLGDSSILAHHLHGDYSGAIEGFSHWTKIAGKVSNGLVERRKREANAYQGKGFSL